MQIQLPDASQPEKNGRHRVVIVGVVRGGESKEDVYSSLFELEKLVDTLGAVTVERLIQTRNRIDAATFIGSGKARVLAGLVKESRADWVAFDHDLTPAQGKNLEKLLNVPVVDRCGVILNIFSSRARTSVAKMQVELARLTYMLPRLKHAWTHLSRQQGGIGGRGVGEKQIELDRRATRKRISVLKRKLAKVATQRDVQREERSNVFKVALVGYTNSGKSTLLNILTEKEVYVEDKLFSTLDAKVANFAPPLKPTILLSDTVGFIRKLPHSLVESFRSTLEEAAIADLLLQVVDSSNPLFEQHLQVGNKVIDELGLSNKPKIVVFNKIDKLADKQTPAIITACHRNSIAISAFSRQGVDELVESILRFFDTMLVEKTIEFDYVNTGLISRLYEMSRVNKIEYLDETVRVRLRATRAELSRISKFIEREGETNVEH